MYKINKVNSWNGWDPLKQVILGNVFLPEYFEDLPNPYLRDKFQQLLYETHEDLNNIQKTLEELGVDVVRPHPNSTQYAYLYEQDDECPTPTTIGEHIQQYRDRGEEFKLEKGIPKPCLSPRDYLIVLGNKMLVTQNMGGQKEFFTSDEQTMINPDCMDLRIADEFSKKLGYESHVNKLHIGDAKRMKISGPLKLSEEYLNETLQMHSTKKNNPKWWDESVNYRYYHDPNFRAAMCMTYGFWAPQITRVGDTLVIDVSEATNLDEVILDMYPEFKRANTAIGGHNDGSFNLPKPGLCIAAPWIDKETFRHTLPGWEIMQIEEPGTMSTDYKEYNKWQDVKELTRGRYWMPGIEKSGNDIVRQFVDEWLGKWVGMAEETIFEVNMLSINENTILSMNYQKEVHEKLRQHGMEPIYCRFRHRNFWDAGLHCLTVDTVREGGMQNYFD